MLSCSRPRSRLVIDTIHNTYRHRTNSLYDIARLRLSSSCHCHEQRTRIARTTLLCATAFDVAHRQLAIVVHNSFNSAIARRNRGGWQFCLLKAKRRSPWTTQTPSSTHFASNASLLLHFTRNILDAGSAETYTSVLLPTPFPYNTTKSAGRLNPTHKTLEHSHH